MMSRPYPVIQVVDSHTGGEPTRVVVAGGPELPAVSVRERLTLLRSNTTRSVPQSSTNRAVPIHWWEALLCPPTDPTCTAGVIFFNNVGYLGMCGHGTIGLVATLAHLGRIQVSTHRIETPVGVVSAHLHESGAVTVRNVASYRKAADVAVEVPGHGRVTGDVAWGGNWFFLVSDHGQELTLANLERLTEFTWKIRQALAAHGITGVAGQEIDHIELFGPSTLADSRNFVLCPGKAYDRSPCGTGTSAKLACLVADGKLQPGAVWRQESIVGSVFEGTVELVDGHLFPSITGTAFITAETRLVFDPRDPFCHGIRP